MKIIDVKQNTDDWRRARMGIPTASNFDRIVTASGGASQQRFEYMGKLIWERIYNKPMPNGFAKQNFWIARGSRLEEAAAQKFSEMTGDKLVKVGFVTTDDGRMGCSPDRLLEGYPGHGVEIKVPTPWKHIQYTTMGPEKDYFVQMQGQMLVAELEQVDFFSFNPGMPCVITTFYRDPKFIKTLKEGLEKFCDELDKHETKARGLGDYRDMLVFEAEQEFYGLQQRIQPEQDPDPLDSGTDREDYRDVEITIRIPNSKSYRLPR
jgi:hypothetical protein